MNKTIYALLLLFVLFILPVRGEFIVNLYSNEFSLASPSDNVKICSCGSRLDMFEITNVGNVPSLFSLSTESAINDWIALSAGSFELDPGQARLVSAAISIPCGKEGSFGYVLHAKTNFGREKTFQKPVVSQVCQNIRAVLTYYNKTIDPCQTAVFDLEVENVGTFSEEYEISLGDFEQFARYSEKTFSLLPGQKKVVYITVQLPCETYGTFNLPFKIHAKQNDIDQYIYQELIVNRGYDFLIGADQKVAVCSQVVSKVPIAFRNNANVPNDYKVTFDGPAFVSFDGKDIHLEPGQEKILDLIVNPKVAQEGTYALQLTAASDLGKITKSRALDLSVNHCYEQNLMITPEQDTACCGKKSYIITLENAGLYEETFRLKAKSSVWTRISQEEVTLAPGEVKEIILDVDVPCLDDRFEMRIIAEADSTGLSSDDVMTIQSLTTESCTRIDVQNDVISIKYGTASVPLRVKNIGIKDATYAVSYESTFMHPDISEIFLKAGEEKTILLFADNLSSYFKGVYLDDARFLTSQVEYNETVKVVLGERDLFERFVSHLQENTACLIFFLIFIVGAVLALLLIFTRQVLVFFKSEDKILYYRRIPYAGQRKWQLFFTLLVAFLVLFLIAYAASNRNTYSPLQKPLYVEIYQGESYTFNLSGYFEDPDDDLLVFESNNPSNIAVDITGNVAIVSADENFYGERELKFTAEDGKGGIAESAIILVKIIPKERLSFAKLAYRYCPVVFVLLLLVVWLVAFSFHVSKGKVVWYYRDRRR
ncbi:MAG: hypothetical protein ABIJ21_03420 [Nanoarchaeota archaeon]